MSETPLIFDLIAQVLIFLNKLVRMQTEQMFPEEGSFTEETPSSTHLAILSVG